jgi:hypothetical protein
MGQLPFPRAADWCNRDATARRIRSIHAAPRRTSPWHIVCNCAWMLDIKAFLKSGHAPTLCAAFIYFTFSCLIWVLNGAMAPFINETFSLTPAQTGLMLSIPILAGALMRFPLGVLAQYIGRKLATIVEMSLIAGAMLFGYDGRWVRRSAGDGHSAPE